MRKLEEDLRWAAAGKGRLQDTRNTLEPLSTVQDGPILIEKISQAMLFR